MNDHQSFDIIGTWHSPPKGRKPFQGEWGETRITMTFTSEGTFKSIVDFMDEEVIEDQLKVTGKYDIKGNLLYMDYDGDGSPNDPIVLSRQDDFLVMKMDGEVYTYERI